MTKHWTRELESKKGRKYEIGKVKYFQVLYWEGEKGALKHHTFFCQNIHYYSGSSIPARLQDFVNMHRFECLLRAAASDLLSQPTVEGKAVPEERFDAFCGRLGASTSPLIARADPQQGAPFKLKCSRGRAARIKH